MVGTNFSLLQSIFGRSAFLSESGAEIFLPYIEQIEAGTLTEFPKNFMEIALMAGEDYFGVSADYVNYPRMVDGVLLMPFQGAVLRSDICFSPGTTTYQEWYKTAAADKKVLAILELANSPGGGVDGVDELAKLKASITKPIMTLIDTTCASAMYYIALGSNAGIYSTTRMGHVGSIGAMGGFKRNKDANVVELYADTSPKKNAISRALQKGDTRPYIDFILNPPDADFMAFAKLQRPQLSQDALDGMDYYNSEAQSQGLIDGFMTLEEAISHLKSISNQTKQKIKMGGITTALLSLLPKAQASTDEETAVKMAIEISGLQTSVATLEKYKSDAELALTNEKVAHTATASLLATALTQATAKDAEIAKLTADLALTPAGKASEARGEGNKKMGDSADAVIDPVLEAANAKHAEILAELGIA